MRLTNELWQQHIRAHLTRASFELLVELSKRERMEPHWGLMSQCGSGSDTSSSLLAWPPRLWRRAMAAPMAALGQDYRCGKGMESYTQSTCSSILIIAKLSPQHPLHCIGWVAPLPLFVPHRWHLHLSPQYDVLDHTNHIFSVRIWSWQYISVIISPYEDHHTYICYIFKKEL